jgi:UMF1 family MFS transporter
VKNDKRTIFGWAMYDWANSAYSTVIAGAVLPVFFEARVVGDEGWNGYSGEAMWSFVAAAASAALFLLMPVLGAMADFSAGKKRFLAVFAYGGAVFSTLLFFAQSGAVIPTLALFFLAQVGFVAANVLYDGILTDISTPETIDKISARGFATGYIGGGLYLLIAFVAIFVFENDLVTRSMIAGAGLWWGGFTAFALSRIPDTSTAVPIPDVEVPRRALGLAGALFLIVVPGLIGLAYLASSPELGPILILLAVLTILVTIWWRAARSAARAPVSTGGFYRPTGRRAKLTMVGFLRTWSTVQKLRRFPELLWFVVAFMLYNDGIQTTIEIAAVYASGTLELDSIAIAGTFLVVQFVAFGGALLFGSLAHRLGIKSAIQVSLLVWIATSVTAYFIPTGSAAAFLGLGVVIGFVLGGTQALSRSLYGSMIPEEASAEFFGFYSVFSKFSAIWGPLIFAFVRQLTGSGRPAILSLVLFFILGSLILARVDVAAARASKERWAFEGVDVSSR